MLQNKLDVYVACFAVPLIKLVTCHKIKVGICHHVTNTQLNGTKYQHCDKWIFRRRIF